MGCGVVVVVVVWVDRRHWVAGFIGGWLGGWAMGGFVGRSVCSWWWLGWQEEIQSCFVPIRKKRTGKKIG